LGVSSRVGRLDPEPLGLRVLGMAIEEGPIEEDPKPPPEKKRGFFSRFLRAIVEAERKKVHRTFGKS